MPTSYSLYELNEYIKRVIALNFNEPIWVNCEISQVKEVRGNVYLDLVYHDEKSQEITAQITANIWYKSLLFLKNKLGNLLPSLLREGSHVLIKVQVEFNERYGMKLIIEDIDPSYTIGQMEMNRQKILHRLREEGLIDVNKSTNLPSVLHHIAVISSSNAAGFIDFDNHIKNNPYGYSFKITLFNVALQGQNTERDVCRAFEEIDEDSESYDAVLIIRGGGSKLDLSGFDNFNIGAKISRCKIPVITGIGHEIDTTVADTCAFRSLKTPTAVADFIIERNLDFESKMMETTHWIGQLAKQACRQKELSLHQTIQILKMVPAELLKNKTISIENCHLQLSQAVKNVLIRHKDKLMMMDKEIMMLNPKNTLKRGYAIIRQEKKVISRSTSFQKGQELTVEFFDKEIKIKQP